MKINNLFPTPVVNFSIGRNFTKKEIDFVMKQPTYRNMGNTTSNNSYILNDKSMKNIKSFVEESVKEYIKEIYAPKEKTVFCVTQSWLNYTKPGEFHHKHSHPNSVLSGVLYIKALKDKDRIYFYRNDYQQIKLHTENWNIYNSESWWLEACTGELYLFPSSLTHMVENVEKDERISLAFNTFPVGLIGSEENLTGLYLKE